MLRGADFKGEHVGIHSIKNKARLLAAKNTKRTSHTIQNTPGRITQTLSAGAAPTGAGAGASMNPSCTKTKTVLVDETTYTQFESKIKVFSSGRR